MSGDPCLHLSASPPHGCVFLLLSEIWFLNSISVLRKEMRMSVVVISANWIMVSWQRWGGTEEVAWNFHLRWGRRLKRSSNRMVIEVLGSVVGYSLCFHLVWFSSKQIDVLLYPLGLQYGWQMVSTRLMPSEQRATSHGILGIHGSQYECAMYLNCERITWLHWCTCYRSSLTTVCVSTWGAFTPVKIKLNLRGGQSEAGPLTYLYPHYMSILRSLPSL